MARPGSAAGVEKRLTHCVPISSESFVAVHCQVGIIAAAAAATVAVGGGNLGGGGGNTQVVLHIRASALI